MNHTREHAHGLIERLPDAQVIALAGLLETMVDPVGVALRDAPFDEEESQNEKNAIAEAHEWLKGNGGQGIPHAEAMRRLGLE